MRKLLMCLLFAILATIQFGSTELSGQEPKAEHTQVYDGRVVDVVYQGAFSKNDLIRERSYSILSTHKDLLNSLDEGNQLELVKSAIYDENSAIAELGLRILVNSEVENTERFQILMTLIDSKNRDLAENAIGVLYENREQVLKQLIATIENDLTGSHKNEFLLIERLGPTATAAVPVIVKSFHAKKAQAQQALAATQDPKPNASEATNLVFDYLPHVYAIAEIGTAAQDAMPIALAAAEEEAVDGRTEYPVAGMICIERLLSGKARTTDDLILAARTPDNLQKYQKYADSLIQQYDKNKDGILDQREMKTMRRPPTTADQNHDGMVTRNELFLSLAGVSSGSRQVATPRNSVRETVSNSLQKN